MKKTIAIFGLSIIAFAFSGCRAKKVETPPAVPKNLSINSSQVETEKPMESGGNRESELAVEEIVDSLRGLISKGKSVECEFLSEEDGVKINGTYYIDGQSKKLRGKMNSEMREDDNVQNIEMHTIMDGEYVYSWNSIQKGDGIKFKANEAAKNGDNGNDRQKVDLDKKMDFKCREWKVDASLFILPANYVFKDISSIMTNPAGAAPGQAPDTCAMCGSLPAESQADCKSNFCK